jgi:hypothetical protein
MNIFKKLSGTERLIALALAMVFLGMIVAPAAIAEEESEKKICEKAWLRCMVDAAIAAFLSKGASILFSIQFCLDGYVFCERYVEPLLDRG